MRSQCAALAPLAVSILATLVEAVAPPATGWLYDGYRGRLVFPFAATQCEPFHIFYNSTFGHEFFFDDVRGNGLFFLEVPEGIGYVQWICNIPAGLAFRVNIPLDYIVQPGSSSACLGDLSTTYSLLDYVTTNFASYTRNSPHNVFISTISLPTTSYPTDVSATVTLNPDSAVVLITPSPSSSSPPSLPSSSSAGSSSPSPTAFSPATASSSPSSSPTSFSSPTTSQKSRISSVVGGIVGAAAFVLLTLALIFVLLRRRRSPRLALSSPTDPVTTTHSESASRELGSACLLSPFQNSAERLSAVAELGSTPQNPFSPLGPSSHGSEPISDSGATVVSVSDNPAADMVLVEGLQHASSFSTLVGPRSSQGTVITPSEVELVVPPQRRCGPPAHAHKALLRRPVPTLELGVSRSADQQAPYAQSSTAPVDAVPEMSLRDAMTPSMQSSTSETQEGPLGFTTVLEVISRAQLSQRERQVITSFNNRFIQAPSTPPDSANQDLVSSPPPYTQ